MINMKKTCIVCKKDFESNYYNKKKCSPECIRLWRNLYNKQRYIKKEKPDSQACILCNKQYIPSKKGQKYCSKKCSYYSKFFSGDKPRGYRTIMFKETSIMYFLKKYCELGDYIMRYGFFYNCYISFLKKDYLLIKKNDLTRYFNKYTNIRTNNNTRASQKKLFGLRFNEKGMKRFGVENVSNLDLGKEITSSQACIELSCKQGRFKIQELYNSLEPIVQGKIDLERFLINYKQIETFLYQRNLSHRTNMKMSVALYLTTDFTQKKCAKMTGCTSNSLRFLFKQLPINHHDYYIKNNYNMTNMEVE